MQLRKVTAAEPLRLPIDAGSRAQLSVHAETPTEVSVDMGANPVDPAALLLPCRSVWRAIATMPTHTRTPARWSVSTAKLTSPAATAAAAAPAAPPVMHCGARTLTGMSSVAPIRLRK